ncbi:hypothetical protein EDD15DRAFT_2203332 [Pisolithus albus]|nr:hypothetical protein EDD15DRAFT_2203332 [Pisolithus albus]
MAELNVRRLAGGVRTVLHELERVENIPAPGGIVAVNARVDRVFEELNDIRNTMQGFERRLGLMPMQLYNLLQGDNGILDDLEGRIPNELPNTLNALRTANRNQCDALADHLDIPLQHNLPVNERRRQIANFLGVRL